MPSLDVNPFEFVDERIRNTRILKLSVYVNIFVILACVILTQCQRVTRRHRADHTV